LSPWPSPKNSMSSMKRALFSLLPSSSRVECTAHFY
jgi:hypothetical protein